MEALALLGVWSTVVLIVVGVGLGVRAAWRRLPDDDAGAERMKQIAKAHDIESSKRGRLK